MKRILADLEFANVISEAQAQTSTGAALLDGYKAYCLGNECSCALVNNFIREASKCTYDNGVNNVLNEVADYINANKVSWQIASACESILSKSNSYNMLNMNAAKQAEKLLEMQEDEVVKYIKAGALKNVMFCEAFRTIAKSVFKNQPMMESNAEFNISKPISIVEKNGEDLYFEVLGNLYKINEDSEISAANWNEVSNTFKNIASLLESNNTRCFEDTLSFTIGKYEYQINESNMVKPEIALIECNLLFLIGGI